MDLLFSPLPLVLMYLMHPLQFALGLGALCAGLGLAYATRWRRFTAFSAPRVVLACLAGGTSLALGVWQMLQAEINPGTGLVAAGLCLWLSLIGFLDWQRPIQERDVF